MIKLPNSVPHFYLTPHPYFRLSPRFFYCSQHFYPSTLLKLNCNPQVIRVHMHPDIISTELLKPGIHFIITTITSQEFPY